MLGKEITKTILFGILIQSVDERDRGGRGKGTLKKRRRITTVIRFRLYSHDEVAIAIQCNLQFILQRLTKRRNI